MLARILIRGIRVYQRGSRWRPPTCRFVPSCSHYAVDAIQAHGALRGMLLTLRRLLRCHPFAPGGLDPVPGGPAQAMDTAGFNPDRPTH